MNLKKCLVIGKRSGKLAFFVAAMMIVGMIGVGPFTASAHGRSGSNDEPALTSDDAKHPVGNGSPTSLNYTILFAEPRLQAIALFGESFTTVNLQGGVGIGQSEGAPTLPVNLIKLLLPAKTKVTDIEVTGEPVEVTMPIDLKENPIIPYQNPVPIGDPKPKEIAIRTDIYDSNDPTPGILYDNQKVGYCRGYAILSLSLHPVQYIPAEGKLSYYPNLTINVELEENGQVNQFYRNNLNDEKWVQSLVYNPEMTKRYQSCNLPTTDYPGGICDPSDDYDYVIITTTYNGLDHWVTTPSIPYNWTSLMNKHAADDGLSCTLVTIQDIDACPDYWDSDPLFNDTPAHIREFCKDAYQDWDTEYIFIGGDQEWIPARLMDYDYESNVESDLYWSNLNKTFNADHDNDWGEEGDGGFDLYSELYIGRIPCDEPQDVSNWMKKSFYYTDSSFRDYLENAAFYGCVTGWNCEGDDFIDYSAIKGTSDWLGPSPGAHGAYPSWLGFQYGFETWNALNPGMEYNLSVKWSASSPNPGWQGGSESIAVAGMKNDINNDNVTLISGIAHANEHLSLDVYDYTWESDYHNTMPFFIHDYGCHCGDMDAADDGVLHSMLFHSDTELAFACVYNTGYGWGSFDDTNSSSALQQKLFWDYMFDTANNSGSPMNWQMGKAMAYSKDAMAPTINWTYTGAPGSWRGIIESCLLFGDPAQRIKPPVQPEHNIGIQEFDVSSHEPADTDIWVNATLYNNGKHNETDVEVRFLVNGVEENSTNISFFEKGTLEEVGWLYHTPSYGWETLCVNVTMVPGENISIDNVVCREVIYGPDIAVTQIQAPGYLGQGFAKPVKGYVQNLGPTDENVTINFIANNTLINTTNINLTSGSSGWVTFMWDATTSGLGTYNVTIHAVPVANEYYLQNQNKSHEVNVFAAIGNVLLVDDDKGDSYESWYENALLASSYVYEIYDRDTQPAPSPSLMQGYTAVVWFTGDDWTTTLDSSDQSNLATFLDNGGRLFITGQDIGYDINTDPFYSNYLHANHLVDTAGWDVAGETGDPIGDGLAFGISSGDGANNQNYPDGIAPIGNATSCFYYNGTAYKAGIKVSEGAYRIVYFGFGFEAINHMTARTIVMSRILSWLAAEHEIAVTNLDVLTYIPYNVTTYVKATIINGGINDESNIVVNFTVNGTIINSTTIPTLNAGQSQLVSFAWNPAIGVYLVGIEAQPVPGENITSNNALYKTVHVIPAPDIWVDPTEFNFYLNEGVTVVDTLIIGNEPSAEGNLTFNISLSGSGAGEWIEQWSHTYGGMGHSQFAQPVGDIDEDGKNETLVGGYASDTTIILSYNQSTGNYEQEYEWTEGAGTPSGVCVVDLDGDGDLEFAVSWVYGSANGVYAYDWDGTTLTELDYYSGTGFDFAFDVYACDYDEDGDIEVLIANDPPSSSGYHVTALGWSGGSFVYEASWGSGESTECPMIWSGDTDNDGHIEVITTASYNKVHALNWNGSGWNADVVASGLSSHPYAVVCGDIDGDGIDEIGVGLEGTDAYIYEWDGSNYVQAWQTNYPGEEDIIEAMYFGDADNDGNMELLVGTDDVHVIAYSAGSYYEESVITQTDGQLSSAIIADMDDDGENEVKACDIISGPGKEWIVEWREGWLSVDPTGGMVEVGNSMNVSVIVNSSGLAEGDYHSTIIVTSNDLDEPAVYIPVNLSVVFEDDVGAISVDYPTGVLPPDNYTVNATIKNFGTMNQTSVLVNCSIYEGAPGYSEDFESDDGGYTHDGPTDLWAWGTPTSGPGSAHSGSNCWGTVLDDDYVDDANAILDSVPINLAAGFSYELSFWHWYDTELRYDGGNVKISTDGGSTWSILGSYLDPYNEDEAASGNAGIPGEPCFSGHGQGYWENVTFNLSSYAGEEIILRWHFGSDGSVSGYPGWFIDDVEVYSPESRDAGDLVYTAEATLDYILSHTTEYVEFTPPWDALPGTYVIKVKTMLPGDQDPSNDQATGSATIIAANDTGVVSINRPTGLQRPGDYAVNATVRNFGSTNQTSVPVNCSIYNESDVMVYSADTTVNVDALNSVFVEFSPSWTVTDEGDYLINVTTLLAGDAQPNNDANETVVTIQAYTDVGVTAINRPTGVVPPSDYVVNATVENFGGLDKMVPVNCSIYEGVSYSEDFEADNGGYTHAVGPGPGYNDDWEWGTPTSGPGSAHSGVNVWATNLAGDFQNYGDMVLDSVSIDLSAIASPQLTFWHWYDFSGGAWDGGNVKISTDGGSTWNLIYPDGGYPGTASSGNQGIPNEECYTNDVTSSWEQTTFDLNTYSGETAIIRWHCGTTTVVTHPGWYIDDVNVSSAGSFAAGDLVYSSETTVFVEALNTSFVEFTPPWNATLGNYTIKVTTMLPGDENADNDQTGRSVEIKPPTIDHITITETEGGTEIADQTISLGWNKTGYASAYNNTCGYIGLVSVNWSVVNVDGANATTFPLTGNWSTFNAGESIGNATWKADDGNGHNDTVIFEITGISVDIPLYLGWNLITIPVENDYTAKSLIENISGCQIVCCWDSIDQEYECFTIHSPSGYDFPIENGMGYFIGVTEDSNFSVTGRPISNVSIDLHIGWNLIGWFNETSTTAMSLLENITSCEIVCRWGSIAQEYDCFTSGSPPEYSFPIEIGMGLFVGVTEESIWHGEG